MPRFGPTKRKDLFIPRASTWTKRAAEMTRRLRESKALRYAADVCGKE